MTQVRGWIGPMSVAAFALGLRLWHLGRPHRLLFDETYYAKDAWAYLNFGYVRGYRDKVDSLIEHGHLAHVFSEYPAFIVHPDVGRMMIAGGEWLFGMNSFGWRVSAAVVGALSVLVLARLVQRLTGSVWLGCFAGMTLALDGLHFVMSRLALLDGFLTFWLLCAVGCLVADADWLRARLAIDSSWRRFRPWLLTAGVCFGLAAGTKWAAAPVLATFGIAVVCWELAARRTALRQDPERPRPESAVSLFQVGVPAFCSLVGVAGTVYVATWTGWLLHSGEYANAFAMSHNPVVAFAEYHQQVWDFHTGSYIAKQTHPFQSNAEGWLILERPVGVDARTDVLPGLCNAPPESSCTAVISLLGNPAVWWTGAAASAVALVALVVRRRWQWSVPVLGVAATWLPWIAVRNRPIFSYYAVATLPFMIIATSLVLNGLWQSAGPRGRRFVVAGAAALITLTAVCFWWWWPIYTDKLLPADGWLERMWLPGWR